MKTTQKKIDNLLRDQPFSSNGLEITAPVYHYAESMAMIEKSIVVVSDLKCGESKIFYGGFSGRLGISYKEHESSIWEKDILDRIEDKERGDKFLGELRFFNYIRRIPLKKRSDYYLAARLRMRDKDNALIDVLHRMYYWNEKDSDIIRYGICVYSPMVIDLPANCIAVNSITGEWAELLNDADNTILSPREKEVLILIENGLTSSEISLKLSISKNTVNRHRQEILLKLLAKNSTEACRRAKQLKII